MRIIAYTYEADHHCIDCALQRYQSGSFDKAPPDYRHSLVCGTCHCGDGVDEHGVAYDALDSEGNYVHPLFNIDEWQELDESYLAENPTQYLACGDCHEVIEEYTHIS
jgi:hypothetical protein